MWFRNCSGSGPQVSAIEIMGCCSAISDGLLGKLRNILPDTRITTIGQIVNTQIETNRLMAKISLILLVIISLVGAISIANYMWANVEERKREIGTLLTLGATRGSVYRLFFAKSIVLGVLGGVGGYLAGDAVRFDPGAGTRGPQGAAGSRLPGLVAADRNCHRPSRELVSHIPCDAPRPRVDPAGVLSHVHAGRSRSPTRAGAGLSMRSGTSPSTIEPGSFVTVTGPSGSGKTTLLLTLGGLIRPTSGQVLFHGTDIGSLAERKLSEYRNRSVGFVLQSFNLIPYLSAFENVMVPMSLHVEWPWRP